jgi:hypothetical protein
MRPLLLAILAISILLCLSVSSCCRGRNHEEKVAAIGISPTLDKAMMHDSPLYKYLMTNAKSYVVETQEFLERIQKKHTPTELQAWAQGVLNAHSNEEEQFYLPSNEIPDFVLHLDPPLEPFVIVHPHSGVTIAWGGGFGFWGLFVGNSKSKPPENPALYVIEWAPGVQAFHDIQ